MFLNNFFPSFPPQSKVWVYNADRILNDNETFNIQSEINLFTDKWQAHGMELKAAGKMVYNNILILVVDETVEAPSGCSIDSSVHFIKTFNDKYGVNFLNRNYVVILKDNKVEVATSEDKEKLKGQMVLNTACSTLAEVNAKLFIDFEDSSYAKLAINKGFSLKL